MSAPQEGTEGSSRMSRPSSVDPNIYILYEAICSSMETSIELLSATMQKNKLAASPSIEGNATSLSKKQARTSSQVARNDSLGIHHTKNLGT